MLLAFINISKQSQDVQFCIGQDDITAGVELQVQPVKSIGKLKLEYTISANLGDGSKASSLQVLAQFGDKGGWGCSGCPRIFGEMATEARIDEQLFAVVWFVEFDKQNSLFVVRSIVIREGWLGCTEERS